MTVWPPDVRARAIELHVEHGPREAARRLAAEGHAVPWATVASWARRAGAQTECIPRTRAAMEAAALSMNQRRQRLAESMLAEAELCMEEMHRAATIHHWTKDGEHVDHTLVEPTFADRRQLATIAAILVDKSQLLSGEATGRVEGLLTAEPASLRDEAASKVRQLRPA
jgi:hypothetical protein